MRVSHLALNDYRSYRELVLELPGGHVVFKGRNGRGKTNLVEAIGYLSTFSSHRVNADRALLRVPVGGQTDRDDEAPAAAVVRAKVLSRGAAAKKEKLLELEIVRGKANRARLNRGQVSPRELLGNLRTVMFAPEDLQLLRGEPGGRRKFVDEMIVQLKPSYLGVQRDLNQTLRQRGALFKQLARNTSDSVANDLLAPWDEALADLSAQVAAHRMSVVASIEPLLSKFYAQVSEEDKDVSFEYDCHLFRGSRYLDDPHEKAQIPVITDGYFPDLTDLTEHLGAHYKKMIAERRVEELRRAGNLVGAHLDDLETTLAGLPVKGYASQGETWSFVLALRLAQMELLTSDGDPPVLILDDVFAELDENRRAALAESIADIEQVLITTAIVTDVPQVLNAAVFEVTLDGKRGSLVHEGTGALEVELNE